MIRGLRFPHPLTLLIGCIITAAALSYVLPAGEYDRVEDPDTGRRLVVAGSYHPVARNPVNPFEAFVAVPVGMIDAGEIVFLVFLIGGAFAVVDRTGALRWSVEWLVGRFGRHGMLVVPVMCLVFGAAGALYNMKEEIIALIPPLLVLTRRLGVRPIVAVSMSVGSALVGAAFSPINPFQVGLAQRLAELSPGSGGAFRGAFLAVAMLFWIGITLREARRSRTRPPPAPSGMSATPDGRHPIIMGLVVATFAIMTYGILGLEWGFNQLSALFFIMGMLVGLTGRLGLDGTAVAYVEGFKAMALAGLLIGFARTIFIVLEQGRIVDTIVHGIFTPITGLPVTLSALGMMVGHVGLHVPVPSVTGHAVLTMPVLVPVSDLLGLSRQVTVLAFQMGGWLCDLVTPTNGALMAILASAGVGYEAWLGFVAKYYLALMALGALAIVLAIGIGV